MLRRKILRARICLMPARPLTGSLFLVLYSILFQNFHCLQKFPVCAPIFIFYFLICYLIFILFQFGGKSSDNTHCPLPTAHCLLLPPLCHISIKLFPPRNIPCIFIKFVNNQTLCKENLSSKASDWLVWVL